MTLWLINTAMLCFPSAFSCQNWEGGLGGVPGLEAHGGYTFCGTAALVILGKEHMLDLKALLVSPVSCLCYSSTCYLTWLFLSIRVNKLRFMRCVKGQLLVSWTLEEKRLITGSSGTLNMLGNINIGVLQNCRCLDQQISRVFGRHWH